MRWPHRSRGSFHVVLILSMVLGMTHLPKGEAMAAVDWAQPPVACVEEVVPRIPDRECPDFSAVDPSKVDQWPVGLTPEEIAYWEEHKQFNNYCRSAEIMRREQLQPGSFSAFAVEMAWMRLMSVQDSAAKVAAVYEASRRSRMPAQVLTGALYQESLFADLGIAEDGSNYSCGIGQINLIEWCRWANEQSSQKKAALGWPADPVACGSLNTTSIRPFYQIAKTRLNGLPEYRLEKSHFKNIKFVDVEAALPGNDQASKQFLFRLAASFINNCSDSANGIIAKASELKHLFSAYVPKPLRERDLYGAGTAYARTCEQKGYESAYPLHTGWLLAVGIYNAGPRAVDALAYYQGWTEPMLGKPTTWKDIAPADLIEAFYWGGKYNPLNDRIEFTTLNGALSNWIWFKPCVLQRHIARVVQHVTLPGTPMLVDTLEGPNRCAKSQFHPDGTILKSAVPLARQQSSGRKVQSR